MINVQVPRRRLTVAALTAALAMTGAVLWLVFRPDAPVATALMTSPQVWNVWPYPAETLTGTLDVSEQGCVVLRRADGDVLLIAEHGSRLLDGGTRVDVSRVGTFTLGEPISQGGEIGESWRGGKRFTPPEWDQCVGPDVQRVPTATMTFVD